MTFTSRVRMSGGLAMAVFLVASCGGDDAGGVGSGGMSPLVDPATGWTRTVSVPLQGPTGIDYAMSLTTMTLFDGDYHLLTREARGSQGGDLVERFDIQFPANDPASLSSAPVSLSEQYDSSQSGGYTASYRYDYRPESATLVQSFRESHQSGGFDETHSGTREIGGADSPDLRSPGGFIFAGLADLAADGTALVPGAELGSALLSNGDWTRYYGRWSDIAEPLTRCGYPARLSDGAIYWGLIQDAGVALGVAATNPELMHLEVKTSVLGPAFADVQPTRCIARAFGDQLVIIGIGENNNVSAVSAYRWTIGATTIETLYANVSLPVMVRVPALDNTEDFRVVIDVDGGLTFFSQELANGNLTGTALFRASATGAEKMGAAIPAGAYTVQGPWLVDGSYYAGVGTTVSAESAQLDLVRAATM